MEAMLNHRQLILEIFPTEAPPLPELEVDMITLSWFQTKGREATTVVTLHGFLTEHDGSKTGIRDQATLQPDVWPDWVCDLINQHSPRWGSL